MSVKIKNISQAEVHVLKEQISYQEHHLVFFCQGRGDQYP